MSRESLFRSSARRVRQNKDFELNDSKCLSGMNHNKLSRKVSIFQVSKFDSSLRTQSFYRPRGTEYLSAQREGSALAAHRNERPIAIAPRRAWQAEAGRRANKSPLSLHEAGCAIYRMSYKGFTQPPFSKYIYMWEWNRESHHSPYTRNKSHHLPS